MFGLPADCFVEGKLDTCFLKTLHFLCNQFLSFCFVINIVIERFLLPSTNDKNESLTNGMQTFFFCFTIKQLQN